MSGNAPGKAGSRAETRKNPMTEAPRSPVTSAEHRTKHPKTPCQTGRQERKAVQDRTIPHSENIPDDADLSQEQRDKTRKRAQTTQYCAFLKNH